MPSRSTFLRNRSPIKGWGLKSLKIHLLQSCNGTTTPNQVWYDNAFTGLKAGVRYTYKRDGFEQDVILEEQPPAPESYGLNSSTTVLQAYTEFISPPSPVVSMSFITEGDGQQLPDKTLAFSTMKIGRGRAFLAANSSESIPVAKDWATLEGRQFLIEQIPISQISDQLQTLPAPQASVRFSNSVVNVVSAKRLPSGTSFAKASTNQMRMASLPFRADGFVLDYTSLNTSQTNYTFRGDMTYYISGNVNLYGTNTTFEGGTVIKYDSGVSLAVNTPVSWYGSVYRPVVMVAKDDNSVAQSISGSTGSPGNSYYAAKALYFDGTSALTNLNIDNLRILNAQAGVVINGRANHVLSNVEIAKCAKGIVATNADFSLRNALFSSVLTNFSGSSATGRVEHLTTDVAAWLNKDIGANLFLTNCILSAVTNVGSCTTQSVAVVSSGSGIFQTAGAGAYYLADSSPYRDAGTTNINPVLAVQLARKTTYPPVSVLNTNFDTATTLGPVISRDTDTPDLGFHYDAMDYVFSGVNVNANMTISAGTAIGWFKPASGNPYAIHLADQIVMAFNGEADAQDYFVRTSTVQEGNTSWGTGISAYGIVGSQNQSSENISLSSEVDMNFTTMSVLVWDIQFHDYSGYLIARANNSTLAGGNTAGYVLSSYFTNCFLDNQQVGTIQGHTGNEVYLRNCTSHNGQFYSLRSLAIPISARDCAFDGVGLSFSGGTTSADYDYNAYTNATDPFPIGGSHDKKSVTFNWQVGPLGRFYLPTNSVLINAGDVTADTVGLSDFTTQTNQSLEFSSTVDMGYHYYGDSDFDGLLDWWEYYWFGVLSHTGSESDALGNSLLADFEDYTNAVATNDPNIIRFSIEVPNNYVMTSSATLGMDVSLGTPAYYSVLVDSTNFASASWTSYTSTNLTASLGSTQGWHEIWVGLKGPAPEATITWVWKRIKLDTTAPTLVLTNPPSSTVDMPMIQVYGYSLEDLDSISCDVSNVLGVVTNLDAGVMHRSYSTNTWEYTTNFFECLDVPLTNGVNRIIIHATDLAGNVTTLATNITVDYTGKTAPVVQLTWPQDGMALSGTNFTIRGQVDDPTVTVMATIIDTNHCTNILYGMVERNGRFWVDCLPLNGGTNAVSIVFSNIVSQATVTNFNVTQSAMTLAMDDVSDANQLWQPTISVTGTISDTSASVQVNGVAGVNNGDGTWKADNVPMTAGGVATFDTKAVPATGDPANVNSDLNKPARLYLKEYTESDGGTAGAVFNVAEGIWTFDWTADGSCRWDDGDGGDGSYFYDADYENIDFDGGLQHETHDEDWAFPASSWPSVAEGEKNTTSVLQSEGYGFPYSSSTVSGTDPWPAQIVLEHCQVKMPVGSSSGWPYRWLGEWFKTSPETIGKYQRTADATMELQTGGRAESKQESLFCLTGSADKLVEDYAYPYVDGPGNVSWGSHYDPPTSPISMQEITIDGRPLGSDGKQWRSYSDNTIRDVTPRVKGKDFYAFTISQQKYRLLIQASGHGLLQPDRVTRGANCIVGQIIDFSPSWNPPLPEDPAKSSITWQTKGNFFNSYTNIIPGASVPTGSEVYFFNPDSLNQETLTNCWWVSGGNPTQYDIVFGAGLTFDNGQYAAVTARGLFNMYRPLASVSAVTSSVNVANLFDDGWVLKFNDPFAVPPTPGISFYATLKIPPAFSGSTNWVQTVQSSTRKWEDSSSIWHQYIYPGSGPWLDTVFFYPEHADGNTADSPQEPLASGNVRYEITEQYRILMTFTPSGGMWVPMWLVNWSWNGIAVSGTDPAWRKESGDGEVDSITETENYPLWKSNIVDSIAGPL